MYGLFLFISSWAVTSRSITRKKNLAKIFRKEIKSKDLAKRKIIKEKKNLNQLDKVKNKNLV